MFCLLYMICEIFVFAKIWFVKTSTGIMKFESQVVKLKPGTTFGWMWPDIPQVHLDYWILWSTLLWNCSSSKVVSEATTLVSEATCQIAEHFDY